MLQQILKDMYIDPDVLDALNEDQKKTLFLKMRQEQVRRWKEREEKLEREGGDAEAKRTKKATSKSVSWLLGRDGDVAVLVIGEVDELGSKFICSGFGEKKAQGPQNNTYHQTVLKSRTTTEPVRNESETLLYKTHPAISLNLKPESKSVGAAEEKSVPQASVCSRPPTRVSPVNVRPASANATPGSVNTRAGFTNLRLATATPYSSPGSTVRIDSGTRAPTKGGLCSREPQKAQESQVATENESGDDSRCRCVRSVSEGSLGGDRVSGERTNLRRAWPRGPADENLQRRKHYNPRTDPLSQYQTPSPHQAQPLASNDHTYCQVIHASRRTGSHPVSPIHVLQRKPNKDNGALKRRPTGFTGMEN
ncbi:putative SH2 domain-containing protein 4A-like [Scophthalmus maximus]|uniref:Putative SH2 domain-containing protein 4A-like n=1 Tax=Scophthalmus maximus TaxID=52904 RepID=A0A2U9B817_SCOMX|nr:putative SH2 domain-containing protein 4A-like [Scophthalmus maximus]